jgi:hypothetical protein
MKARYGHADPFGDLRVLGPEASHARASVGLVRAEKAPFAGLYGFRLSGWNTNWNNGPICEHALRYRKTPRFADLQGFSE